MQSKEKSINLFTVLLSPFAIAALIWALSGIALSQINAGVMTLGVLTIFCSCYLRIKLPRADIHLTISDGLISLRMLFYVGGLRLRLGGVVRACSGRQHS